MMAVVTSCFIAQYIAIQGKSFNGLEYEDAFEYVYSGHVLGLDRQTRQFKLNPVCVQGSFDDCTTYATLAHPIGLSTLISWPVRLIGNSLEFGNTISLISMWIAAMSIYFLLLVWKVPIPVAGFSSLMFLSAPVSLSIGVSSLAEPVSAALVMISIVITVLVIAPVDSQPSEAMRPPLRFILKCALWSAMVLAIFTKREAISLTLSIPVGCILVAIFKSENERRSQSSATKCGAITVISSMALAFAMTLGGDALLDWSSIRPTANPSFSIDNIQRWGLDYVKHLISPQFLLVPPLAVVGASLVWKHRQLILLLPIVGAYLILFASFGHSYYAQVLGNTPYFHFERYTLEILPILSVMAGLAAAWVFDQCCSRFGHRASNWGLIALGCIVIGIGTSIGMLHRESLRAEEARIRTIPVKKACAILPEGSTVITFQPILFHLFCRDTSVRVIARPVIGQFVSLADLRGFQPTGLFLWERTEAPIIENTRYPNAANLIKSVEREQVFRHKGSGTDYSLYQLWDEGRQEIQ
jgi:hypothetical protein